jgi:hypothetical protein
VSQPDKEFWYSRSRQFHLLWFLFLGGLMLLGSSFHFTRDSVAKLSSQLSKYGAGDFTIEAVRIALLREFIPISLGLIFAFLSPLLSIFAYYMIERSELSTHDKRDVLYRSHVKAILATSPILLFGSIIIGLTTVYFASTSKKFYDLFNFYDCLHGIFKVLLFEVVLLGVIFLETKILCTIKGLLKLITICFLYIYINAYVIIAIDYGIVHLVTPP